MFYTEIAAEQTSRRHGSSSLTVGCFPGGSKSAFAMHFRIILLIISDFCKPNKASLPSNCDQKVRLNGKVETERMLTANSCVCSSSLGGGLFFHKIVLGFLCPLLLNILTHAAGIWVPAMLLNFLRILCVFLAGVSCIVGTAIAAEPTPSQPCGTCSAISIDWWVINTRCAPKDCFSEAGAQRLRLHRWVDKRWQPADLQDFLSAEFMPTTFVIHGNNTNAQQAIEASVQATRAMLRFRKSSAPVRVVIWSWPSEQEYSIRIREDLLLKAKRSDVQGFYLAWVWNQMAPEIPLGLVGYSYGARAISAGLHLLDGGTVNRRRLPNLNPLPRSIQAALIAAAVDNTWLSPGQRFGQALNQVQKVYVSENPIDPALKRYNLVFRRDFAEALGGPGLPPGLQLGVNAMKVFSERVSRWVGPFHRWSAYYEATPLMEHVAPYAFPTEFSPVSPEIAN